MSVSSTSLSYFKKRRTPCQSTSAWSRGCFTVSNWQQPVAHRGQGQEKRFSACVIDWSLRWVGNWLTQWQRSHLSHQLRPTASCSSNFLRRNQILPMIASSQPGSASFHDSIPFLPLLPPCRFTASRPASKRCWRLWQIWGFQEISKESVNRLYAFRQTAMAAVFISDCASCQNEAWCGWSDKKCKHWKEKDQPEHKEIHLSLSEIHWQVKEKVRNHVSTCVCHHHHWVYCRLLMMDN